MTKRGEALPINQAMNRSRTKLGLELSACMAIVFFSVTVFLVHTAPSEILIPPGPSIAYVALNDGQFACIDTDIVPLVQGRNWYAVKDPKSGRMYPATHRIVDGKHEFLSMRTLVLGIKPRTSYAVNMNNLDCRAANLRDVSEAQSSWRTKKRSNNKTGYTGIYWSKDKKRFVANMQTNGVKSVSAALRLWKRRSWHSTKLLFGYEAISPVFNMERLTVLCPVISIKPRRASVIAFVTYSFKTV